MMVCPVCPRHCSLASGETGWCRGRMNKDGKVVSANYGAITSAAMDPIEKKPFARFHPGSYILSVGSYGCNLGCPFCQNSSISQASASDFPDSSVEMVTAEELVSAAALQANSETGNIGIAFTYNEPLISWEFARDCGRLLHEQGLLSVLVTNGMICRQPLTELLPYVDAMNIDLKGFSQKFYDWIGGDLETVMQTIKMAHEAGCHVEITTLIIPGKNDDPDEIKRESAWLASLSPEIPLHITRFFPRYKCTDLAPTPAETIRRLCRIAEEDLRYVYPGNL